MDLDLIEIAINFGEEPEFFAKLNIHNYEELHRALHSPNNIPLYIKEGLFTFFPSLESAPTREVENVKNRKEMNSFQNSTEINREDIRIDNKTTTTTTTTTTNTKPHTQRTQTIQKGKKEINNGNYKLNNSDNNNARKNKKNNNNNNNNERKNNNNKINNENDNVEKKNEVDNKKASKPTNTNQNEQSSGPKIEVLEKDITELKVEAIVNAANSELQHYGGVARAISDKGGAQIQKDSNSLIKLRGSIPIGSCEYTKAGKLPAKYIIHTVGPSCSNSNPSTLQQSQLRNAIRNSLRTAEILGLVSIAIPSVSTGIFGFPVKLGIQIIAEECISFAESLSKIPDSSLRKIYLVDLDPKKVELFRRALQSSPINSQNKISQKQTITISSDVYLGNSDNDNEDNDDNISENEEDEEEEEEGEEIDNSKIKIMADNVLEVLLGEMDRITDIQSDSKKFFEGNIIGKDWNLSLKAPPLPPPLPIVELNKNSPEFNRVIESIEPAHRQSIYSIRKVSVIARTTEYSKEQENVRKAGKQIKEENPLFHGTPERWRATAIAINGFNLGITLNGRALGNGVYSSKTPAVPMGYVRGKGSLLIMKGLITESTVIKDPVHVFPNPKHVLPEYLADFSNDQNDRNDELEKLRKQQLEEKEKIEAIKKNIIKQEKDFKEHIYRRWLSTLNYYHGKMEEYNSKFFELYSSLENSDFSREDVQSLRSLCGLILREKYQFESRLPIYGSKSEIVQSLRKKPIMILLSGTGSGKSTQIPQYLLDEIAGKNEKRKIAVLQPRRVNAITLCERVSEERKRKPGTEVGYHLGGGKCLMSENTRIEFMTHGLFVQLSQDIRRVRRQYFAVVLDEAHERSVDVDLTFALLQKVLEDDDQDKPFYLIIASATIENKIEEFQGYLDPTKKKSAVVKIEGITFPVHVEHRSDVSPEGKSIGTGGVGKVLTSYAIQTSMDIMKRTKIGNILVFLPGKGNIIDAVSKFFDFVREQSADTKYSNFQIGNGFHFYMPVDDDDDGINENNQNGKEDKKNIISNKERIKIGVYPFYGKSSTELNLAILNPDPNQRNIVFTTNVAETGLTIPNIRYVIDTGLERCVSWNPLSNMKEMVTQPAAKSSITQRSGRAGRIATGYCIRLFSESSFDSLPKERQPDIQKADILKAVLMIKSNESNNPLTLMQPIPDQLFKSAEEMLKSYSALDKEGKISDTGIKLLGFGVDIRLGSFLIACAHKGCLQSGSQLVSIISVDTNYSLLPTTTDQFEKMKKLIDSSGDHLTLLNVFKEFSNSKKKFKFCKKYSLDYDILLQIDESHEALQDKLASMKFDLNDTAKDIRRAILQSLSVSNEDQIVSIATPGVPPSKNAQKIFGSRILPDGHRDSYIQAKSSFLRKYAGTSSPSPSLNVNNPLPVPNFNANNVVPQMNNNNNNIPVFNANNVVPPNNQEATDPFPLGVRLGSSSVINYLDGNDKNTLAVFQSIMMTDTSSTPTVELASFVSKEDITENANQLKDASLVQLINQSDKEIIKIPSTAKGRKMIENTLQKMTRRFHSIAWKNERESFLVFVPKGLVNLVRKKFRENSPENIELVLPDDVNYGKLLGKGRINEKEMTKELNEALDRYFPAGDQNEENSLIEHASIQINKDQQKVVVTLSGNAKKFASVAVGILRSQLHKYGGIQLDLDTSMVLSNSQASVSSLSSNAAKEVKHNPRLSYLTSTVPPQTPTNRNGLMLFIVWILSHKCGLVVYGGFVRDWVINGEDANDIDTLCPAAQFATTKTTLSNEISKFRATIVGEKTKGAAHTLIIRHSFGKDIEVDLVDQTRVPFMHPGVDCNAGNMAIFPNGRFDRKLPIGLSLNKCKQHCEKKQFVFYYKLTDGNSAQQRLNKYLAKGWKCINLPPPHFVPAAQHHLFQPKAKYRTPSW